MFRAHRQAWAWQDEWHGMTMEDIRELERQTQLALQKKMGLDTGSEGEPDEDGEDSAQSQSKQHSIQMSSIEKTEETPMFPKKMHPPELKEHPPSVEDSSDDDDDEEVDEDAGKQRVSRCASEPPRQTAAGKKFGSKSALHSPIGSTHSFDLQVNIVFVCFGFRELIIYLSTLFHSSFHFSQTF